MNNQWIDLGMNEGLTIRDAADGPFFVLYPLGPGPHYGNIYRVAVAQRPDGQWRAQVPLMPQCDVTRATREEAKTALVATIMDYLRKRITFIRDTAPLIERYIVTSSQQASKASHGDDDVPSIKGYDQSLSSIMRAMGDAFAASSIGDDSRMIDAARIANAAKQLDLPKDVVRAAIAYYLEHKEPIRKQVYRDLNDRLDRVFTRIQEESGLNDEEFAKAFASPADDAA